VAITNNGQPQGPIQFTDAASGARVFIGGTTPTTPAPGDIWIDSDVQNNAGKNTISETTLSTASVSLTVPNSYKDVCLVLKNVQLSTNGDILVRLNADSTGANYLGGSALHTISSVKAGGNNLIVITIQESQALTPKFSRIEGVYVNSSNALASVTAAGGYSQTTSLTTINLATSTGTFAGGTATVYGVN